MFGFPGLISDPSLWESHLPAPLVSRQPLNDHADLIRIEGAPGAARHLLVPPISGHAGTLMLDLVHGLLETASVDIVELHDPALRPGELELGFEHHVSTITRAMEACGDTHLIGACQSTAASLSAASGASQKLSSLTLLAAPMTPGDTGVAAQIPSEPGEDLSAFLAEIEGLTRPAGSGRTVLPGDIQLAAILSGKGGAARILFEEGCVLWSPTTSPARRARAQARIRILSHAQSIDRRLLMESLEQNFVRRDYQNRIGNITCPVHLVGGENDSVIPATQVHGAKALFTQADVQCSKIPSADHFDLFCGEGAMQLGHSLGKFSILHEREVIA